MGKTVKLYVNGIEKHFIKLHYNKSHPNQDPDFFEVTMDEDESVGITSFQTVEIKKDGVTEFYGFVEEISPNRDAESGAEVIVSGRCWKLIIWKKFSERFQESREIGPEDYEGNLETGFFGSVNPVELFKFILRCPISVHPKDKIRHKIGWGIPSDNWICCANETAEARYPDWVALRYTGLAWRGRGTVDTLYSDILVVDGFDSTYTEWDEDGISPYLDTDDEYTNCIKRVTSPDATEGDFSFQDLNPTRITVYNAWLTIKFIGFLHNERISIYLYDGTDWNYIGQLGNYYEYWVEQTWNISTILNTITKVNSAKIRFVGSGGNSIVYITYAYLKCTTGIDTEPIYQQNGDWFAVNLGQPYDRVTAILIECRNNLICYPENYHIQYTTLSNCCDDTYPPAEEDWQDFDDCGSIINISNNSYRDVLHSWTPIDDVYGIRIKLTVDGERPWEISQIYVWQADELKYRILNET